MLEQPSLLLRCWIHSRETAWPRTTVQGAGWLRAIVNPATDQSLGVACWADASWWTWLGRKKIQVFETEDESLLMTLCRPWGIARMWEILDAEDHIVGYLHGDAVYDGQGARLALMSAAADGTEMMLRGDHGDALANWQDIPGQGRYFRFGDNLDPNPFVRMATLASVLALPPWPGDIILAARPAV